MGFNHSPFGAVRYQRRSELLDFLELFHELFLGLVELVELVVKCGRLLKKAVIGIINWFK